MTATVQQLDYHVNLMRSVLWQHEGAPNLVQLAANDQAYADSHQSAFWSSWLTDVYNLRTANPFGLVVWSIILDYPLRLNVSGGSKPNWGFGSNDKNYDNASFASTFGGQLTVQAARLLLLLRWWGLHMSPTVPNLNYMLKCIFGDGVAYIVCWPGAEELAIQYYFNAAIPQELLDAFAANDILPRPAGVKVSWQVTPREGFGYDLYHYNFDNGSFVI